MTACLYPNRDYIVTATTFRVPDRRRFDIALEQGWSPDDPGNIKIRITDGLQQANAGVKRQSLVTIQLNQIYLHFNKVMESGVTISIP